MGTRRLFGKSITDASKQSRKAFRILQTWFSETNSSTSLFDNENISHEKNMEKNGTILTSATSNDSENDSGYQKSGRSTYESTGSLIKANYRKQKTKRGICMRNAWLIPPSKLDICDGQDVCADIYADECEMESVVISQIEISSGTSILEDMEEWTPREEERPISPKRTTFPAYAEEEEGGEWKSTDARDIFHDIRTDGHGRN